MGNVCQNGSFDVLPFLTIERPKVDGSYWRQFHKQLQCELLQNIEDRATPQKHVKRARDPITMVTINTKPDEATKKNTRR